MKTGDVRKGFGRRYRRQDGSCFHVCAHKMQLFMTRISRRSIYYVAVVM